MRRARAASSEPEAPALSESVPHRAAGGAGHGLVPADERLDALVGEPHASRRRGRMRRRLRHLRRVREVLLRDLGGLVFELHRTGHDTAPDDRSRLVEGKLARLGSVDAEIRELEQHLDDRRPMVLREPGIGGACTSCGELFGSDARFCWACGTPVAPSSLGGALGVGPASRPALPASTDEPRALPPREENQAYVDSQASPIGARTAHEEQPTVPFDPLPPDDDPETQPRPAAADRPHGDSAPPRAAHASPHEPFPAPTDRDR